MNKFGVATKAYIFRNNKLLILYKTAEEAANDPDPDNRKDVPGGRLEFGESPTEALFREVKEESGLLVDVLMPLRIWTYIKNDFQLIGVNYLCEYVGGEVVLSNEHESFEWCSKNELMEKNWNDLEQYLEAFEHYEKLQNYK